MWKPSGTSWGTGCRPYTDPSLPVVDRELATTFNLSEVYAFFLQRMALSRPVLESVMGLPSKPSPRSSTTKT
jgi:hypothetical protein